MRWPSHHPLRAFWELSWFDRRSGKLAGQCRVGSIDPDELAKALVAAITRCEGTEPSTAEHVMGGERPVDQELAAVLQPYVPEAIDLEAFYYSLGLVDESGGKERREWGDFVDEQ